MVEPPRTCRRAYCVATALIVAGTLHKCDGFTSSFVSHKFTSKSSKRGGDNFSFGLCPRTLSSSVSSSCPRVSSSVASSVASTNTGSGTIGISSRPTEGGGSNELSDAAQWHRERRRQMLEKYGTQISSLEREASSQSIALPLLGLANLSLLCMSIWSGSLHPVKVLLLAIFPGSMFSLWQLQILHDSIHGCLLNKGETTFFGNVSRRRLQDAILFWGSMPSVFGYYLYLKYGHLTHHKHVGDPEKASLQKLFNSTAIEFADGDVLFVAHRMKLKGEIGPSFTIPPLRKGGKSSKVTMSISKMGFNAWKRSKPFRNALLFTMSFMYERLMLTMNDVIVAASGRNFFFPQKPKKFHDECAKYTRCAILVRSLLFAIAGWKSLLFLYLSETLWSIPPLPSAAMFVTNHGSDTVTNPSGTVDCVPTASTYSGSRDTF
mmetsp:Transcript_8165/g.17689  ORF Transcript_8165/g.17689 Transcript_8165/m.17689 type:complete len:434 (-) Transcript_8165:17-1318(-)